MIEKNKGYFIGIVLGIRFRANFSIEDQLGKIVDTILYSKNSFFNPDIFPNVRNLIGRKMLFNEITQDKLSIDNSNIILEINFAEKSKFKKENISKIVKAFEHEIISKIMLDFKIREIIRIGYIKKYIYQIKEFASSFVDKTIGNTIEGISDINLRFSKKFTNKESLTKKDIFDYDNVIFNIIKKSNFDEIFISIDYQRYFDPFLMTAMEMKFKDFIQKVNKFNENNYQDWINKYYTEAIDVKKK